MKPESLATELDDLISMTKKGTQKWNITMQTTEKMEDTLKDHITDDDGKIWCIDECYTDFSCTYLGNPFHLISYENIQTCGSNVKSNNLLFIAPDGMRRFQLDFLAPYNIQNSAVLTYKVHDLWTLALAEYKKGNSKINFTVSEPSLEDLENE